ncbi:unnamed protein product [Brugia pahangi]|uniref:C2H2-type domain-containing protein n=1 Tax=Brugia pahangi TaxID=6280 RepID=A0A0N4TB83_BRUPA|nr:unnamed protein product [Brugia pahangi]
MKNRKPKLVSRQQEINNYLLCEILPISSERKSYECLYPGCAVIAKSYNEYVTHRKTHGQPFIYECKVAGCGRTFDYKSSLSSHKKTHEPRPRCECLANSFTV